MMWRTHLLCGINALWLLTPLPSDLLPSGYGAMAIFAGVGALLPDLGASESKIKHLRLGQVRLSTELDSTSSVLNVYELMAGFLIEVVHEHWHC
jgi:hypothetical protein